MEYRRGIYTRIIAWSTLIASLAVLLYSNLGGIEIYATVYLKGFILLGAGLMILFETVFDRNMNYENPFSINFLIGIPSGIIAVILGAAHLSTTNYVINLLNGFEGGIYLAAIIILGYEGTTAALSKNIGLKDFKD